MAAVPTRLALSHGWQAPPRGLHKRGGAGTQGGKHPWEQDSHGGRPRSPGIAEKTGFGKPPLSSGPPRRRGGEPSPASGAAQGGKKIRHPSQHNAHPSRSIPPRQAPMGESEAPRSGGGWKSAAAGEKKIKNKKNLCKINQKAEGVSHLHASERKGALREQTAGEEGRRRAGRIKRHGVTTPALKIGSGPATGSFTRNSLRLSTSTPLPGRMAPTAPARSARGQS